MNTSLLRCTVAIVGFSTFYGTTANAEPPAISAEVAQTLKRFFAAIRQNNVGEFLAVANGVEVSLSDSDVSKMSLSEARREFPNCKLAGIASSQHLSDSAYSFNGTIDCVTGGRPTQTVGVIADRERVYMIRPGGFASDQKTPAEIAKAEANAQEELDWLASHSLQMPAGPFKVWSKSDQQHFPTILQNTCTYIWTMAHDSSDRLFPVGVSSDDEWTLGINVCVVGHMPADWPQRGLKLQPVLAVLHKAAVAGSTLKMPAKITP